MKKRDYIEFQNRTQPLAFLITFRTYGTWLHGEDRGSIDRRNYNRYGTRGMPPNERILRDEKQLGNDPVFLNVEQRDVVKSAIKEVCDYRRYLLHAENVRTNHVHVVVTAPRKPEHVMNSFKSHATRKLREKNLMSQKIRPWARHGSTRYLWSEQELESAIDYVINGQGNEPSNNSLSCVKLELPSLTVGLLTHKKID